MPKPALRPTTLGGIIRQYFIRPATKILFPVVDETTGLKQARKRYYKVRIVKPDGTELVAYQGLDTSGRYRHLVLDSGKRYFTQLGDHVSRIDDTLHTPTFAEIDWRNVWKNGEEQ